MSQVAAAMIVQTTSVSQEPPVAAVRSSRSEAAASSENLRDTVAVRKNSSDETTSRTEPKLFKDVLEKRLPANAQSVSLSSESSTAEKSDKKKTKPTIQDLSNIALLTMNPTLVQASRKITVEGSGQGTQSATSALSATSSQKKAANALPSSAQGQGQSQDPFQSVAKVVQGKEALQISPTQNKDTKGMAKTEKGSGEPQGLVRQAIETDSRLSNQKNPSSQAPESNTAVSLAGYGNPNLNPKINQGKDAKVDLSGYTAMKPREGASRTEEVSTQQETKSKKSDKSKSSLNSASSQNENSAQSAAQSDDVLSFSVSQHSSRQTTGVSGKTDSITSTVSSIESTPLSQSPGRQVAQAIREQLSVPAPQQEIQMTLNPPDLGKVRIVFQQNNQEITGLLEVEKLRTRSDIQKELPQVLLSLQNAGVQIRRLEVVMNNPNNPNNNPSPDPQAGNQAFSDPFMNKSDHFFASDSRQEQSRSGSERSTQDFQSTLTPDNADQRKSFVRDDAINVYL